MTRSVFTLCFNFCEMVHIWANSHYFHCHLIGQLFLQLINLVFWSLKGQKITK